MEECDGARRLSDHAYITTLKLYNKTRALPQVKNLYAHILRHKVQLTGFLGDYLAVTLAKCGALECACQVFFALPHRTAFSWTALMSTYVDCGQGQEALRMYKLMLADGVEPDHYTFVTLFKACGCIPDLEEAKKLHAAARLKGSDSDIFIGNTLVSMYGKCGGIGEAETVFSRMPQHDVISYNAMLSAYVKQSQFEKALQLFRQMQEEKVILDQQTIVFSLQSCSGSTEESCVFVKGLSRSVAILEIGRALHSQAKRERFCADVYVGSALVSMYSKCRSTMEAENVFNGLPQHDIVLWTAMLSTYVEHCQEKRALHMYCGMLEQGLRPDQQACVIALQACGNLAEIEEATVVQGQLIKVKPLEVCRAFYADACMAGFPVDVFLGSTLVSVYGKCGSMVEVETLFNEMPLLNVVMWNAMMSAYIEQGDYVHALQAFRQMHEDGVVPNLQTVVIAAQACSSLKGKGEYTDDSPAKAYPLEIGQALHSYAKRKVFVSNLYIGSVFVNMYGNHGGTMEAENVFIGLSQNDVVSWTAMLLAYVEHGQPDKALRLYGQMHFEGVDPTQQTFVVALQACGRLAGNEKNSVFKGLLCTVMFLEIGQALHGDILRLGFDSDIFVGNSLITMYGKCGSVMGAEEVFKGLLQVEPISWNAMLSVYTEHGQAEKALKLFRQMQEDRVILDQQTCLILLQSCCALLQMEADSSSEEQRIKVTSMEIAKALHKHANRNCFSSDIYIGNTLMSVYGKCQRLQEAESVFVGLTQCDVVSWTAMLLAYLEQGQGTKALQFYMNMELEGFSPDEQTYAVALQACLSVAEEEGIGKMMALEVGHTLHTDALKKGVTSEVFVGNLLVRLYGMCGSVTEAEIMFNKLCQRNVVSWNALLTTYAEQGHTEKALWLYTKMLEECATVDDVTLLCVLQACGDIGSLENCWQAHCSIVVCGCDLKPTIVNTLLHSYGSCASTADAQATFDWICHPDVVSWSACIAGYARDGNFSRNLQMYGEMQCAGVEPGEITYLSFLVACGHAGLVKEGTLCFSLINNSFGLAPGLKHFVATLDLFGRAGDFDMVEIILCGMAMEADLTIWTCLLGACRVQGNVEMGKLAFGHAVHLQPEKAAAYILMSNVCNDAGQFWDLA